MKIINQTKGKLLADKVIIADTFLARIKGLLGKNSLEENEALIIRPCSSIHTFFMRFAIDVVFLDRQNRVVAFKKNLVPFRLTFAHHKACLAIELPAHKISQSYTQLNDLIKLEK
jgi:hypothetical protein